MPPHPPPDLAVLLAHDRWVRRLALSLVDEPSLAEDAVQDTWLAFLRRGPGRSENLRGWLAEVLRNAVRRARRGETRRAQREVLAARAEGEPSALEVVERFSTLHALSSAVLALEEPLRTTVLERFYEGRRLREIAARAGVSISAVEARLQRGLEHLRRELDQRHGERRTWALAVLALAQAPRGAATSLSGATLALRAAAVVGCVAVGLMTARALRRGPDAAGPVARAPSAAASPGLAAEDADEQNGERVPLAPRQADGMRAAEQGGTLELLVTRAGLPAGGVHVLVWPLSGSTVPLAGRTERDGLLRIAGLPPGELELASELGPRASLEVMASGTTRATLELPRGPKLRGRVVDELGRPVGGAGLWLSAEEARRWIGEREVPSVVAADFVARTADDGSFVIEDAGAAVLLGARAPGAAPSRHHVLGAAARAGAELTLVLRGAGGALGGRVRDDDGAAVAGAAVFVDALEGPEVVLDGKRVARPAPELVTFTDALGAFRVEGVQPGSRQVRVTARGRVPWRGTLAVEAGAEAVLEVGLERGVCLAGELVDADGTAVPGALVHAARRRWSSAPDARFAAVATTGADGGFVLEALPVGALWLAAEAGARGRLSQLVQLEQPWTRLRLELPPSPSIEGTVRDREGGSVAGVAVHAFPEGRWSLRSTVTDAEGRFVLAGCEPEPHRLQLEEQGFVVERRGATPGDPPLALVLDPRRRPTARLRGALVGAGGAPLEASAAGSAALVTLLDLGTRGEVEVPAELLAGGRFRSAPVPAGAYRLRLAAPGHAPLDVDHDVTLDVGEELDLGVLALPPAGGLVLDVRRADAGELLLFHALVLDAGGETEHELALDDAEGHLPLALPLAAGRHELVVWCDGAAPQRATVDVRAGTDTRLALVLEPAVPCTLRFHEPAPGAWPSLLRLTVSRADGVLVLRGEFPSLADLSGPSFVESFALPAGDYALSAETSRGLGATASFSVPAAPADPPSFDLRLQ